MFCKSCGTKIDDGTKFCPSCGVATSYTVNADARIPNKPALGVLGLPLERKAMLLVFIVFMVVATIIAIASPSERAKGKAIKNLKSLAFLEQTIGKAIPFGEVVDFAVSDEKWECEKVDGKTYIVTLSGGIKPMKGLDFGTEITLKSSGLDKGKFSISFAVTIQGNNVMANVTGGSLFAKDTYKEMDESEASSLLMILYSLYLDCKE